MKLRLPGGKYVKIDTGAKGSRHDPDERLRNLLETEDWSKSMGRSLRPEENRQIREEALVDWLERIAPVVFPSADAANPIIRHPNGVRIPEPYFDVYFTLKSRPGCFGGVLIGTDPVYDPRASFHNNLARLIDDPSDPFRWDRRLREVQIISSYKINERIFERLPIKPQIRGWEDVFSVLRQLGDDEENTGCTIILEAMVAECRRLLAAIAKSPKLLESIEGRQFEELISTLMADVGFEDVELTRPTKDGGKDIIAKLRNPKTGWTETYLFECKHWLAGDKVRLKIVTRLQDVVRTDKATGGVIVAWGGYAPEVLQQEASLRKDRLHLRDKNDIERWVSYWERTYASPIIVPLNPFEVFGLEV